MQKRREDQRPLAPDLVAERADQELTDREADRGARQGELDGGCADTEFGLK